MYTDKDKFITKAIAIHGNKYDYNKVNYKGSKEKIIIICPEHSEFEQIPNSHLTGRGCPDYGGKIKLTTEEEFEKKLMQLLSRFK